MNPQRWNQVQSLFKEIILLDYSTQKNRLKTISMEDPELYREVKSLIDADTDKTSILDADISEVINISDIFEFEGARIGPFEIGSRIGSGGMGNVYYAKRVEGGFEQEVALKFIRQGMGSEHILERFSAERNILARLQHPNIARLVDGGATNEGQPWFAMEYVEGEPVDAYCKRVELSVKEKIRLFKKVNEAVQYAHRNLIIHRDLKPDNILVVEDKDGYQVKLLDFGIAQLVDDADIDSKASNILTKAYASPEQKKGEPTTTLSDIYSLGVMLYELLTGQHPDENFRRHHADPIAVHPELTAICNKAMSEDPEERYLTVADLNNDLENHEENRPVDSFSSGPSYVFKKFIKRNRNSVSMAAFSALIIAVLIFFYTDQLKKEKEIAQNEAIRSARIAGVLSSSLRTVDPTATPLSELSARNFLDNSLSYISEELSDDPDIQAALYNTMGNVYANLGAFSVADSITAISFNYYQQQGDTLDPEYIKTLATRTEVMINTGEFDEAEKLITQAVRLADLSMDQQSVEYADIYYSYNNILYQKGDYIMADSVLRKITPIYLDQLGRSDPYYQDMMFYLGTNYRKLGMFDSAEVYLSKALNLSREFLDSPDEMIASNLNHMSSLYQNMGEYEKALPYAIESYEQRKLIYGEEHINTVASIANTARTYSGAAMYNEAAEAYEKAISIMTELYGEENYNIAGLTNSLGNVYLRMNKVEEAEIAMNKAIRIGDSILPEGDRRLAYPLDGKAKVLLVKEDYETALDYAEQSLSIRLATLPEDNILIARSRLLLGKCLWYLDRRQEAIPVLARAQAIFESEPDIYQAELSELEEILN